MHSVFAWVASHPEVLVWAVLSLVGALTPAGSRTGQLARRWASDLRGPSTPPKDAP